MARTFPTYLSPIDAYSSTGERSLAYFQVENKKAVSGYIGVVDIERKISANFTYAYGLQVSYSQSDNPTIGFAAGVSVYMDDLGTGVAAKIGMDIGMAQTSSHSASRHAFIRVRSHTALMPSTVFLIEGNNAADNLFDFDRGPGVNCVASSGCTISNGDTPYLKVDVNGVAYGIPIIAI